MMIFKKYNIHSFINQKIKKPNNLFETSFFYKQQKVEKKHFWFKIRNRIILNELLKIKEKNKETLRILEIGCGTGNTLTFLGENGFAIEGADLFLEALKISRQRTNTKLYQFDVRDIPFYQKWDVIGCFDVIEHLNEDELALKNIYKALKPKGWLVLMAPAIKILYSENEGSHKRRYSKKELTKKLKNAGFKVKKISHFMFFLFPLIFLLRMWRKIRKEKYIKDIDLNINPISNWLFFKICSLEAIIIKKINLPIGTSLLAIAQKS